MANEARLALVSPEASGGVAHYTDSLNSFASGKLHSFRNATVEKAYVDFEGTYSGHDGIFGGKVTVAETLAVVGRVTFGGAGLSATHAAAIHALDTTWQFLTGNNATNATNKDVRVGMYHYTNAEEPFTFFLGSTKVSTNVLSVGGGTGSGNAATEVAIFAAANNTTINGTQVASFKIGATILTGTLQVTGASTLTGTAYIGDTANANVTLGLTINQGAADDDIFALKSSDIAHGRTGLMETDSFYTIAKRNATIGGVTIEVVAEDAAQNTVMHHTVSGGTADTTKSTAGRSLVEFNVEEHDGANTAANITADGNIFGVRARVGGADATRFLVDEDGDLYSVTAAQTFDEHDDLALVNRYDIVRRDSLRAGYAEFATDYEDELIALGVLGGRVADGGMTNVTQLQRLHNGALRQLDVRQTAQEERIAELQLEIAETKEELRLLKAA